MKKFKIDKKFSMRLSALSLAGFIFITGLAGCSKKADCDIKEEHAHVYIDEDSMLKRYYQSEALVNNYGEKRTEDYILLDNNEIEQICSNKLYVTDENLDSLQKIIDSKQPKREEHIYSYIYGPYYGWGWGINAANGKSEYSYKLRYGNHWEYVWKEIPLDELTDNKVRDITYEFKFYKFDENGNLISKTFKSLQDIEEGYNYFYKDDLVVKITSESYYLEKNNTK